MAKEDDGNKGNDGQSVAGRDREYKSKNAPADKARGYKNSEKIELKALYLNTCSTCNKTDKLTAHRNKYV